MRLPLNTVEDFKELEERCAGDPEFGTKLVCLHFVFKINSETSNLFRRFNTASTVLKELGTDDALMCLNWDGRHNKLAMKKVVLIL